MIENWPNKKYDIVYSDPPWPYYGSTDKNAAAGKHYDLMSIEDIKALPVPSILNDDAAVFMWVTCPKLDLGIDTIRATGLYYRGVAFVWIKTTLDGIPIGAQGVPPTATKPLTELVLLATTCAKGRPFPLLDSAVEQTVFAPRTGKHSEKPHEVRRRIERLYGNRSRIELFARQARFGWDRWGNQAPKQPDAELDNDQ